MVGTKPPGRVAPRRLSTAEISMNLFASSHPRDVLALAKAINGVMIMPKLHCFCDRYWNFLTKCRFPIGPRDMPIPFWCPQDALYDLVRWNSKKVKKELNRMRQPRRRFRRVLRAGMMLKMTMVTKRDQCLMIPQVHQAAHQVHHPARQARQALARQAHPHERRMYLLKLTK